MWPVLAVAAAGSSLYMSRHALGSAYETARRIAVGPRPPANIPDLPPEIFRLICAELIRECLVDCMLNPYMFHSPQDPEVDNYLIPILLSLAHTCSALRALVIDTWAAALSIERRPDGSLVQTPWERTRALHRDLKHSTAEEDNHTTATIIASSKNGRVIWSYEPAIRAMYDCFRALSRLHIVFDASWPSQTQVSWQLRLLVCSRATNELGTGAAQALHDIASNPGALPVLGPRIVQKAREGAFRATAFALLRGLSVQLYSQLKQVSSPDFTALSLQEKDQIMSRISGAAQSLLILEDVGCAICAKRVGLPEPPSQLDDDIILLSGIMPVVIYMKEKGTVANGVDIASIGRTLFDQWRPRMTSVYWERTGLNDEDTHAQFAHLFAEWF